MSITTGTVEAGGLFWRWTAGDATDRAAGNPLVILHGLFGSGDNWRSQANSLAEGRIVLVPDMPNHGLSHHTDRTTYVEVADMVWEALGSAELAAALPGGRAVHSSGAGVRVTLLGHSMGGKAAMAMAFARPRAVERLIVADIAPRRYGPSHDAIFRAMEAVAAGTVAGRGEADRLMEPFVPEKAVRMFLLKSLVPDGAGRYRWRLNLAGLRSGYVNIVDWPYGDERYDGPVRFIAGGRSRYIEPADGEAIERHFPDNEIETIPEAGHWLHAEARDAFIGIVRRNVS
ncbi:MAG: alpha/beta fold hydrolase [Spirochaetales bacterium]|nr:alpha/beta fold hydrolase [Spirochaetales bacterium]